MLVYFTTEISSITIISSISSSISSIRISHLENPDLKLKNQDINQYLTLHVCACVCLIKKRNVTVVYLLAQIITLNLKLLTPSLQIYPARMEIHRVQTNNGNKILIEMLV